MAHDDSLTQTELAAQLPREHLALMSTICQELTPWERSMQLPMLVDDMPSMRRWLLAEVDELGVGPGALGRRAAARSRRWRAMARGDRCADERAGPGKAASYAVPEWRAGRRQSRWAWGRHLAFFMHRGVPTGPRWDWRDGVRGASFAQFLAMVFGFLCIEAAAIVGFNGRGPEAVHLFRVTVSGSLAAWAAARVWAWIGLGRSGRAVFKAQAAQPLWMWAWRQAAGLREGLKARRAPEPVREPGFDAIASAIERASLGQPPSAKEAAAAREAIERREDVQAGVRAASEPSTSLGMRESSLLGAMLAPSAAASRSRPKRI